MRLWIINHYAMPPTSAGGTRHFQFAQQLKKNGHEVVIIAANYNHFSHAYIDSPAKLGEIDHSYEIPFVWVPVPSYKGNSIARFWNMLEFSRKILQNKYLPISTPPDIILGSSPHLFAAFAAELLARKLNVPFLLEIRDLWPESLVDLGRFTNKHPLIVILKQIEKYLYRRADHIISLLPTADKYLIEKGVKPEKITWLPNSVDIDKVNPLDFSASDNNKFTLVYAGAHGLANDLDTVLSAAKILQNNGLSESIHIRLIGEGPEKKRLQEIVAEQKITMVEFLNAVPKKEIYSTLSKADGYLMLLKKSPVFRWGISPNKLFDYLAMSRPIIFGVETPFNPVEQVNAGICVQPSDPDSLASAIYQLSLLPKSERISMGQRGRDFVLQHHHVSHLANQLENILHTIVKPVTYSN